MRPIRLSIEGLACFKEKQDIDFCGLDLFAISGPTGAGKSTLLDAILFALYGEVPRVGKRDLKEMISAARERVSVRFDFAVGERRYRIARALRAPRPEPDRARRKGAETVRLEEHDGTDFNAVVADQLRTASVEITRLLGLDVNAFTQAVILPQGEFAKFLKADPPRRRREMLRTLLRLDVYERMRSTAKEASTRKKHELDALEQRLREEYGGVSDTSLEALQRTVRRAETQLEERRIESDVAEARLNRVRDRHVKTVELMEHQAQLAELRGSAAKIEEARSELDAARRAAAMIPLIEEADRAAQDAGHARNAAEAARQASDAATHVHEERAHALAQAEEQAQKEIPTLHDRVAKLDRILGRLPELRRLETEVVKKRTRIEQLDQVVAEGRKRLQQLRQEAARQRDADHAMHARNAAVVESAKQASEAAACIHEERTRELAQAEEQAKEIPALRDRVAKLDRILGRLPELRRLETEVVKKRTRIEQLDQTAEQGRKHLDQLQQEVARQQASVEAARTEVDAIGYDAELDHTLDSVRETATKLRIARDQLQKAKAERERRGRMLADLAGEVDRLASQVTEKEDSLHDAEQDLEAAEEALHATHRQGAVNDLRASLVAGNPCPVCTQLVADPPAVDLNPDVAAARVGHDEANTTLRRVRNETQEATQALTATRSDFRAAQTALAEADDVAAATLADIRLLAGEVREAVGSRVPVDDDAVDAWFQRQVQTVATARNSFDDAKRWLETADLQLGRLCHSEEETRSDLDRTRRERHERVADLDADDERLQTVRADIAKVTPPADPEQERIKLSSRVAALETGHKEATKAETKARRDLEAKKQTHVDRARASQEADQEALARIEQLRRGEETARGDLDRTRRERHERVADLDADDERLRTVRADIAKVTPSADPEQERINLSSRIAALETGHKETIKAEAEARRDLAAKKQAYTDRARAAKEAGQESSARIGERDRRVAQARFASVGDVRNAVRDDTAQARLGEFVADHARDLNAMELRVRGLRTELGDERVSEDQLDEARTDYQRLREEVEELVRMNGHLRQQVETMTERLARAKALRERLRARRNDFRLFSCSAV